MLTVIDQTVLITRN